MVNRQIGFSAGNEDELQDLELSRMQRSQRGQSDEANTIRSVDTRALLSHVAHVKVRPGRTKVGCTFCQGGLAIVSTPVEQDLPEDELVQNPGTDEEPSTPPPPGGWFHR